MKRIAGSPKKKSRRRALLKALLNKAKKVIAIFAAMAYDKHLDYDKDERTKRENGKGKTRKKAI